MKKLMYKVQDLFNDTRAWLAVKIYPDINVLYRQGIIQGYTNGRIDERGYIADTIESVMNADATKKSFLPGLKMMHETLTSNREQLDGKR